MAGGPRPPDWMDFAPEVGGWKGALEILKRQWGAFHGTELDLQLRRRGLDTIVLTGVATNFGVEQTAREAWQLGYSVVVAEDATSSSARRGGAPLRRSRRSCRASRECGRRRRFLRLWRRSV